MTLSDKLIDTRWFGTMSAGALRCLMAVDYLKRAGIKITYSLLQTHTGLSKESVTESMAELQGFGFIMFVENGEHRTLELVAPYPLCPWQVRYLREPSIRAAVLALAKTGEIPSDLRGALERRLYAKAGSGQDLRGDSECAVLQALLARKASGHPVPWAEALRDAVLLCEQAEIVDSTPSGDKYFTPLTAEERARLTDGERKVVTAFEHYTGHDFPARDLEALRESLRVVYPAQLVTVIGKAANPQAVRGFGYFAKLVGMGIAGTRSAKKGNPNTGSSKGGLGRDGLYRDSRRKEGF